MCCLWPALPIPKESKLEPRRTLEMMITLSYSQRKRGQKNGFSAAAAKIHQKSNLVLWMQLIAGANLTQIFTFWGILAFTYLKIPPLSQCLLAAVPSSLLGEWALTSCVLGWLPPVCFPFSPGSKMLLLWDGCCWGCTIKAQMWVWHREVLAAFPVLRSCGSISHLGVTTCWFCC